MNFSPTFLLVNAATLLAATILGVSVIRRLLARLRHGEERHAELLGHLGLGFFRSTLDGKLLQVNQALAGWAGYASPEEMIAAVGNTKELYASPSDRAELLSPVFESAGPITFEEQFRRKTGEKRSGRVTARVARECQPFYLDGAVEDTTVLNRTLEFADAQRDLGDKLATACTLSQALRPCLETAIRLAEMDGGEIYLLDPASKAPVLAESTGSEDAGAEDPEMMIGEPVYTLPTEAGRDPDLKRTVLAHANVPILHEGACIGWLVPAHTLREIPDFSRAALETVAAQIGSAIARIQAQEAVQRSQCQLRALFDSLNDFLAITDLEGYILDANRSLLEHAGCSQSELRGKHLANIYSADLRNRFDALRTPTSELSRVFGALLGRIPWHDSSRGQAQPRHLERPEGDHRGGSRSERAAKV